MVTIISKEEVEDLDAALAAFLSAASPTDEEDASLLGDFPSLDEEPSEADLLALEESYVEPSAVEKEKPIRFLLPFVSSSAATMNFPCFPRLTSKKNFLD